MHPPPPPLVCYRPYQFCQFIDKFRWCMCLFPFNWWTNNSQDWINTPSWSYCNMFFFFQGAWLIGQSCYYFLAAAALCNVVLFLCPVSCAWLRQHTPKAVVVVAQVYFPPACIVPHTHFLRTVLRHDTSNSSKIVCKGQYFKKFRYNFSTSIP